MFSCKFSFVYKYLYSYTFYTPSLFLVPDQNSYTKPWKTGSWFWRYFYWYTTFSETFHYLAGSRCHFGGSLLRRDQDKQASCPLFWWPSYYRQSSPLACYPQTRPAQRRCIFSLALSRCLEKEAVSSSRSSNGMLYWSHGIYTRQ